MTTVFPREGKGEMGTLNKMSFIQSYQTTEKNRQTPTKGWVKTTPSPGGDARIRLPKKGGAKTKALLGGEETQRKYLLAAK